MSIKNRLRGLKMKATSRFKRAKAGISNFNFSSARKAALKKAQEASARARKLAGSSKDRQMAVKGAGMKVRSKAKQTAAAARSAVDKGKSAATKRFAAAGGNTKALRAKMTAKRTVSKAKTYGKSAAAIAKNRAGKAKTAVLKSSAASTVRRTLKRGQYSGRGGAQNSKTDNRTNRGLQQYLDRLRKKK